MKAIVAAAIALTTFAGTVLAAPGAVQPPDSSAGAKQESPFACNRLALTPEKRKRHFDELSPALLTLKTGIRELPDGYEFQFPGDASTYSLLAEWVGGERVCCPFFDIDLRSDREGGPQFLRLTGREGTKQFIVADFAPWFRK
ncbi:MAG TPA: hypothetical protein VKA07_09685 [Candidatus Sulfotelmatobacter sp.]|nr:hypothetical protein [Candidatus Sulfotelmatobacter sp.]